MDNVDDCGLNRSRTLPCNAEGVFPVGLVVLVAIDGVAGYVLGSHFLNLLGVGFWLGLGRGCHLFSGRFSFLLIRI